jgi:hypothetical protein
MSYENQWELGVLNHTGQDDKDGNPIMRMGINLRGVEVGFVEVIPHFKNGSESVVCLMDSGKIKKVVLGS